MNNWLTPAAVAGVTAILVQVISVVLSHRLQNKQVTVTDNASFRQHLIDREKNLVAEIQSLSARCHKLEIDLQTANRKILELEKAKNELEIEVKCLRGSNECKKTDDT
jgi:hypothetical protein